MEYNVYCDESCHLEHDGINVMALGAIYCPKDSVKKVNERIRDIKERNSIPVFRELKWTKISPACLQVYTDLLNYFFDNDVLHFRGLLVPDKQVLDHAKFNQTHDDWYYKMYFDMLKTIFNPTDSYNIYIDIKDSHSYQKSKKLHDVCSNSQHDFSKEIIQKLQPIRSDEVQVMQLTDILIGALAYKNRNFSKDVQKSEAKLEVIEQIKGRSGYSLSKTTLYKEDKFNILVWEPRGDNYEL